jgi:Cd2+/Zn2+-exporting ATPase
MPPTCQTEKQHHHESDAKCSCGGHHSHAHVHLTQIGIGLIFLINSFLLEHLLAYESTIVAFSALFGALVLGFPVVWVAFKDLSAGSLNTNVLVALAVVALAGSGHYQETGVVSFFMLLGQVIETRTAEGALDSIHSLIKLTPTKARRLKGEEEEEVPSRDLAIGDVVRVRPGDNVAADGLIVKGQGAFNEANITGESLPVDKKAGDEVFAGTTNLTGVLDIRVTRAGEDTTLGRVRELILAAEKTKLPIVRIMDQYMGLYTPLVMTVSLIVWGFTHDLNRVISVLIVSCPCAFVLATPTAIVAALSSAARLGILIKNVADIELAARINAFVFDKTGTLTTGRLAISRLEPTGAVSPAELLQTAASCEQYSNHPSARAICLLAREARIPLLEPQEFREVAGRGVRAKVNGGDVLIGRASWLSEHGIAQAGAGSSTTPSSAGWSMIHVSRNRNHLGWIGLQDQTRPEAAQALKELKDSGVRRIAMVSGDRQPVAARVAGEIGCEEVVAECLPQDKVAFVQSLRHKGYRVAVVGDGVNDAPALAAGDLGIAMGAAGSDVAIQSATIALMNSDLRRLPFLMRLSRETRRVVNQNFSIGLCFVVGGLALGAANHITPILAAVLHVAGSLLVVFNSFRLVRQGEDLDASAATNTANTPSPSPPENGTQTPAQIPEAATHCML